MLFLYVVVVILAVLVLFFLAGMRIVRPTHRGLVETLGKYTKFAQPGFHWVIPVIQKLYLVNITEQMVNLARTTLRNIIGTLSLRSANSERGRINTDLHQTLEIETKRWGIDVMRTELKEIDPPKDVQETMNKVVKAENEKIADDGNSAQEQCQNRDPVQHRIDQRNRRDGRRAAHRPAMTIKRWDRISLRIILPA